MNFSRAPILCAPRAQLATSLPLIFRGRFFDTLKHAWLVQFIGHRVADRRIVRLIQKWLAAGVLEDGKRIRSEVGTVQGGSIVRCWPDSGWMLQPDAPTCNSEVNCARNTRKRAFSSLSLISKHFGDVDHRQVIVGDARGATGRRLRPPIRVGLLANLLANPGIGGDCRGLQRK